MANFLVDSFTDTNGTALTAHTPDTGGTWTAHGSSIGTPSASIQSNEVAGTWGLYGAYYNTATPSSADYSVTVDVRTDGTTDTSSGGGVFARLSSAASLTGYLVRMRSNGFGIQRFVSGSTTNLATIGYTPTASVNYRLTLTCAGTLITVKCQRLDNGNWIDNTGSEVGTETSMFSAADIGGPSAAGFAGIAGRLAIYKFDNLEAGDGTQEFTKSVSSTLTLTSNAVENALTASASNTISFNQSAVPFNVIQDREVPENTLDLEGVATLSGLLNIANSELEFVSSATGSLFDPDKSVSQDLGLSQSASVVFGVPWQAPWGVAGVTQDLGIVSGVINDFGLDISQNLGLTDEAIASYGLDSTLSLTQSVSGGIGYEVEQDLSLTQAATRGGSEWVRSVTSTLAATSGVLGWNGNDPCFRRFGTDSRPQASGKLSLFSQDGLYSIILRNPEVDNIRRSSYDRVLRETRGGDLIVYRDSSWNTVQTLQFTITATKRSTLSSLQTFFLNTLGQEIILVDWLGEEWSGVVTNPDETYTEDRDGYWTIPFTFEGSKLTGSSTQHNLGLSQSATATVV